VDITPPFPSSVGVPDPHKFAKRTVCDSAFTPAVAKRAVAKAAERTEKDIVGVITGVVSKERRGKA